MISRLRKIVSDSNCVEPNGVVWNDDLWNTYEDGNQKNNRNINTDWTFEQQIDNSEWSLQQN